MTRPVPSYPPPQEEPQYEDLTTEAAIIAAIAAYLAVRSAVGFVTLPAEIVTAMTRLGISTAAISTATNLALNSPLPKVRGGPAARATAETELERRAAYIVNAAKRIEQSMDESVPTPEAGVEGAKLFDALDREQTYHESHLNAQKKRMTAARQTDKVVNRAPVNTKLRWHAIKDEKTDPECLELDGRIFTVNEPPNGVYPGQVHPHCRCTSQPAKPEG